MSYEIIEKLKKDIAGYTHKAGFEEVGMVVETGDGIAKVSGLPKCLSQELLEIETASGKVSGAAFNLEENFIGVVVLGDSESIKVGDRVRTTGKVLSIKVGDEMIGRVVDLAARDVADDRVSRDRLAADRDPHEEVVHALHSHAAP